MHEDAHIQVVDERSNATSLRTRVIYIDSHQGPNNLSIFLASSCIASLHFRLVGPFPPPRGLPCLRLPWQVAILFSELPSFWPLLPSSVAPDSLEGELHREEPHTGLYGEGSRGGLVGEVAKVGACGHLVCGSR